MSEHTLIKGNVEYLHLPYREKNGFTYCNHCKTFCDKLEIQFNEGWLSDWMQVNCGKCHKVIWVCEFNHYPRRDVFTSEEELKRLKKLSKEDLQNELIGVRTFPTNDKKCTICGKPTNYYDCYSQSYFGLDKHKNGKVKDRIVCSSKCEKELEKRDNVLRKKFKENKKMKGGNKK